MTQLEITRRAIARTKLWRFHPMWIPQEVLEIHAKNQALQLDAVMAYIQNEMRGRDEQDSQYADLINIRAIVEATP